MPIELVVETPKVQWQRATPGSRPASPALKLRGRVVTSPLPAVDIQVNFACKIEPTAPEAPIKSKARVVIGLDRSQALKELVKMAESFEEVRQIIDEVNTGPAAEFEARVARLLKEKKETPVQKDTTSTKLLIVPRFDRWGILKLQEIGLKVLYAFSKADRELRAALKLREEIFLEMQAMTKKANERIKEFKEYSQETLELWIKLQLYLFN